MSDLIDRHAVIEALSMNMPKLTTPDGCGQFDHEIQIADEAFVDCMRIIDDLPSAEPVRHGKWKNDCMGVLRCSECGAQAPWRYKGEMYDMVDYRWKANYCPVCGARMDEE